MKKKVNIFLRVVLIVLSICLCSACVKGSSGETNQESLDALMALSESSDMQALSEKKAEEDHEPQTAFVHICGAVVYPGVYEVEKEARVCDVLLLAGGFTEEAESDQVNMAERVFDGMQVVIPTKMQDTDVPGKQDGKINLNTATKEELCTLPGIGESRAEDIILYRTIHGGFSSTEEIMQVSGIKEVVYGKIKDLIWVD